MPEFSGPGVYVEELQGDAPSIVMCGTSVTVLIGHLPVSDLPIETLLPVLSNGSSDLQYSDWPDCVLKRAVHGFVQNGGRDLYVLGVPANDTKIETEPLELLDRNLDIHLVAAPGFVDAQSHAALIDHCETHENRFAVLDGPAQVSNASDFAGIPLARTGKAAMYLPWFLAGNKDAPTEPTPPSGHVCGVFARVAHDRGVWKAPANERVIDAHVLTQDLTDADQEGLNAANVNALRQIKGRGIRIWGARTRAPKGHEMRYVSERRLMSMVEQSLLRGIEWVAFEPNEPPTWTRVRAQVSAFLTAIWRSGALVGETVEQSYFVRCGPETMTQSDLDQGRLVCEVGVSTLRPAEFSILRIEFQTALPNPEAPSE
ncbi:phage tail sheath family protein [Falsiruegeria mediterranea]|jgi:Bacteriophage tail sheath protein